MSGTSLDGIDAAVIELPACSLLSFCTVPYPAGIRGELLALSDAEEVRAADLSAMNMLVGEYFALAARQVVEMSPYSLKDIDLIGSHGQTVFHFPEPVEMHGFHIRSTVQVGDGDLIAERTGITTVSDFRVRDMVAGGQGAPLAPLFHHHLLGRCAGVGAIVNIGGISNVTRFGDLPGVDSVTAFDTGPGNMLIDLLADSLFGSNLDTDGAFAAAGKVDENLLATLMDDPFISADPPKSTGRDRFGKRYADMLLREFAGIDRYDLIATATAFTAESIAFNLKRFLPGILNAGIIAVSGGGVYNKTLIRMLAERLMPLQVVSVAEISECGVNPDAVEAMAFAYFASETVMGRAANLPGVTGANKKVVLGKISPGDNWRSLLHGMMASLEQ